MQHFMPAAKDRLCPKLGIERKMLINCLICAVRNSILQGISKKKKSLQPLLTIFFILERKKHLKHFTFLECASPYLVGHLAPELVIMT